MKFNSLVLKTTLIAGFLLSIVGTLSAQTVVRVIASMQTENSWKLQIIFDKSVARDKIKDLKVYYPDFSSDPNNSGKTPFISLGPLSQSPVSGNIYEVLTNEKLKTFIKDNKEQLEPYILNVKVEDADGNTDWQNVRITLAAGTKTPVNKVVIAKADDIDDADVYVDGQLNGAHKKKSSFSTNIKLQKIRKNGDWKYTPYGFFKLNASTDADADPDNMEFGFNFRYSFSEQTKIDWDNEAKIETERDFENTNFIFNSRLIWMRAGDKIGEVTQSNGKKRNVQIFFRPYMGAEVGKNLISPLAAAEGDGIARVLVGANLRLNYPINQEKGRDINWTNSFTRRWLLTSELGYETDDDDKLQLVRFGKSPRDYFKSNVNYSFNKLFGFFVEYEWGQIPPSYKLVDHRFRVGFTYKFKFDVK